MTARFGDGLPAPRLSRRPCFPGTFLAVALACGLLAGTAPAARAAESGATLSAAIKPGAATSGLNASGVPARLAQVPPAAPKPAPLPAVVPTPAPVPVPAPGADAVPAASPEPAAGTSTQVAPEAAADTALVLACKQKALSILKVRSPSIEDLFIDMDGLTIAKSDVSVGDTKVRYVMMGEAYIQRERTDKVHRFLCLTGDDGKVLMTFFTER